MKPLDSSWCGFAGDAFILKDETILGLFLEMRRLTEDL
jgi:hypothetical protein